MYKESPNKSWLSVHEIARRLSLSPEMIYKQIQLRKLPAIHIGSSVRVDYHDFEQWIASKKLKASTANIHPLLKKFLHQLKLVFHRQIKAVYLYGSQARGTATHESDIDLLVVFKTLKQRWETIRKVRKIAYDLSFNKDIAPLLSTLVVTESEWKARFDPVLVQIRKEGIILQ